MQRSFLAQWNQIQRKLAGLSNQTPDPHGSSWTPNTDVYEGPDGLIVKVELAGVPEKSVEVRLDAQELVITGVRRDPQCSETASGYRFRQMEIEYGLFERVVHLPFPVQGAGARASFHEGMLTVRLPRAPATRTKAAHIHIHVAP